MSIYTQNFLNCYYQLPSVPSLNECAMRITFTYVHNYSKSSNLHMHMNPKIVTVYLATGGKEINCITYSYMYLLFSTKKVFVNLSTCIYVHVYRCTYVYG